MNHIVENHNLIDGATVIAPLSTNVQVILELESPDPSLVVHTVDEPDFTCGFNGMNIHQL